MGSRNVNSAECDHETAKLQVGVFASAIQNYEKLQIRMYIKKKKTQKHTQPKCITPPFNL